MTDRRRLTTFALALGGAALIAAAPAPGGLSQEGQYAVATMYFAGVLWVTRGLPLAVTALSIPVLLTVFGVYDGIDPALEGFADPLIFLFLAGFMLANALQKYNIDRRIALWLLLRLGSSPRRLVLAMMVATAGLSMWVSNTATTAMMTPIAVGVLAQVCGRAHEEDGEFSNLRIATLLGTAYAASIGGVATLIGTPPNAVVAAYLNQLLDYRLTFADWLVVGLPVTVVSLPVVWYVLVTRYPPEIDDVTEARAQAADYLEAEGGLDPRGRRVGVVFAVTAVLWVVGGLGLFFQFLPPRVHATLFGGSPSLFGTGGHQGLLYFVLVGLYAIPALVLADAMDWDDLADIDWGTILLFGGGISLAEALGRTGATRWFAETLFGAVTDAPVLLVVGTVVFFVVLLTEMTSNTAATTIVAPLLIGVGSLFTGTLGVSGTTAAVFLSVAGAIAASFAFALPVATPPNAIVYGSGHVAHRHMLRTGMLLNVVMTLLLTVLVTLLFTFVWPLIF